MSLQIRICSDIHLEFSHGWIDLPVMENESEQVLILAGDVGLADKPHTYVGFLEEMSERFQDVIYIGGNHEFYGTSIHRGLDKIKERVKIDIGASNIHIVEKEIIRIKDVSFVCSTLWASYDNCDSVCMYNAGLWVNDHRLIRTGTPEDPYQRKFLPQDAFELWVQNKNFLFHNVKSEKEAGQKVVMVCHHSPSVLSIADEYKSGPGAVLNGAYASSLEEEIFESKPDLIIHGHTHHSFDYELVDELDGGDGHVTRIICNPRGYFGHSLNPDFDPRLIVKL